MKLSTTTISGAVAALPILLVALSVAPGAGAETDCETVIVETSVATLEGTHAGTFVEVGTDSAGRPLFKSEDGMSLQFIETGSVLDDEYSTYVYSQSPDFEPEDNTLEDASDLEVQDPVVEESIRRALNACGYWVIGKTGTGDTAMYPMAKVTDCADHPVMIDTDSEWIFQETHESEQEPLGVGNVVLECGVDQEEGDNAGENAGENAEDDSGAGGVGKVGLGFGVTVAAVVASFF